VPGSDAALAGSDDVTVAVRAGNRPPVVDAGPDQVVTLPVQGVTLSGTASDDGLPAGSSLSVAWSQIAGPGLAAFQAPSALTTGVSFDKAGTYVLRLSATDGALTTFDAVSVTVQPGAPAGDPPTVEITRPTGSVTA